VFGLSYIGKVVSGVLIVATAIVGAVAALTPFIGLPYAMAGMAALILGAIGVAVITRPKSQSSEPTSKPPTPELMKPIAAPRENVPPATTSSRPPTAKSAPPPVKSPVQTKVTAPPRWGEAYKPSLAEVYRAASAPATRTADPPRYFKETRIVRLRRTVQAGSVTRIKLSVANGDYVFGQLRETSGYEFTWAIVDLKNLNLMERHLIFRVQRGERDVSTATVEWTVPSDGPWFLAFDAFGKQYVRLVVIELWRRRMRTTSGGSEKSEHS
jgi:hypothetical protein